MYKVNDKAHSVEELNWYMMAKTLSMFEYKNLPSTIPQRQMERLLQASGYCYFTKVEGKFYVFWGGLGGERDEYYNPTTINVNNPALKLSKQYTIKEDGVLIRNDDMHLGLWPLMERFHTLMVENTISMNMASFNSRTTKFFSASDDKTKESAEQFIKKLQDGELTVIGDNAMFDGVKSHTADTSGSTSIKDLIEYQQYLKSSLLGELGINAPHNMKRERLTGSEVEQHEEDLSIFVDNMKACRDEALLEINKKYGLNIKCEFAGVWKAKRDAETPESSILTEGR